MTGEVLVQVVSDEEGERAVVRRADDLIEVAGELWALASRHGAVKSAMKGEFEMSTSEAGEVLLSFGTPGEGLGRVTYRMVERRARGVLCERVHDA